MGLEVDKFIELLKNFHGGDYSSYKIDKENYMFYTKLYEMSLSIQQSPLDFKQHCIDDQIKDILKTIFDSLVSSNEFRIFNINSPYYNRVLEACLFTTLCHFINKTRRIKALSIRDFLYHNSSCGYSVKGSNYYLDINNPDKASTAFHLIDLETAKLRKMRHRLFSTREVYDKRSEWSAIPISSVHELSICWSLIQAQSEDLIANYKIFKRIGNLNNDIVNVLKSPKDHDFLHRLDNGIIKFTSKVKKLNFEDVLIFDKFVLNKICENKAYYGINIYRFEKLLRLYNLTYEVHHLEKCNTSNEERRFLETTVVLREIYFPKIYQQFSTIQDTLTMYNYANSFTALLNFFTFSSCLIIDYLIDINFFGEDWNRVFINILNDMVKDVFYDINDIDFSISSMSQKNFEKILLTQTEYIRAPYRK